MIISTIKANSFGSFSGVSNTTWQGTDKRISFNRFHMILIWTLVTAFQSNTGLICMSMILALHSSDDVYRQIRHTTCCRYSHSPYRNLIFTKLCIQILFASVITLWIFCIILLCGDVHLNPCPLTLLKYPKSCTETRPDKIRSCLIYDILIFSES